MGSARREGNTAVLCNVAADAMTQRGIEADVVHLYGMDIAHCTNCGGCDPTGECVIDDDMQHIYRMIEESDIIVFATPVHFSGMSSILKQAVDRMQCLWTHPRASSKRIAAIADGGSPEPVFRNIMSVARSVGNTLNGEWIGELMIGDTDNGLRDDDIRAAREFGMRLADP